MTTFRSERRATGISDRPALAALGPDTRREQLVALAHRLAGDELAVLVFIARRLTEGRSRYGTLDLERDRRDFRHEALEELADAAVYLAAAILRGTTAAGRGEGAAAAGEGGGAPRCASTFSCAFCATALAGRRSHARYCGARCRAAAARARRASPPRTVSGAATG